MSSVETGCSITHKLEGFLRTTTECRPDGGDDDGILANIFLYNISYTTSAPVAVVFLITSIPHSTLFVMIS